MRDAILIFTFSPVQSFISEARRAADLFVGSQILVQMAKAAAQAIGLNQLIYPAAQNGHLPDDVPNVIVARVDHEQAQETAERAHQALLQQWKELAQTARGELLNKHGLPHDATWDAIWERQIKHIWQVFWAAAPIEAEGYRRAYRVARAALDAVKRSRVFPQVEEPEAKDSLSGTREALHLQNQKAKDYWADVAERVTAAKLRPGGRERLDAIGATKRFCDLAQQPFASTSTIASADFREQAKVRAIHELTQYRQVIEDAIGGFLYRPRSSEDLLWPYDGDLLFLETLKPERLEDSYGGVTRPERLEAARKALEEVHRAVGSRPSPYYAIIVLDGDGMGEHISRLLEAPDPEEEHRKFSQQLADFARQVPQTLKNTFYTMTAVAHPIRQVRPEFLIYNGGDDVLAMAPLSTALPMAQALADKFAQIVSGCSASAGLAIVHHLYPLDAALQAARAAERVAKSVPGKAAVAVEVLKRSGERVTVRSKWESMGGLFDDLVGYFADERLSSRFAYDLMDQASIVTALSQEARTAALKQLIGRHRTERLQNPEKLADRLAQWAQALDGQTPPEKADGVDIPQGLAELARWIVFARFVSQGGGE